MFVVTIQKKDSQPQQLQLEKGEICIGRIKDNDIVLAEPNVSKRHAKVVCKDDRYILMDLQSTNRTFVNGHAISASTPHLLNQKDKILIGNYTLELHERPSAAVAEAVPPRKAPGPPPAGLPSRAPANGYPIGHPVPRPQQNGVQRANAAAPAAFVPPVIRQLATPPPLNGALPVAAPAAVGWNKVPLRDDAGYDYLTLPHGWLLRSPGGHFVFIHDPQHVHPPIPSA